MKTDRKNYFDTAYNAMDTEFDLLLDECPETDILPTCAGAVSQVVTRVIEEAPSEMEGFALINHILNEVLQGFIKGDKSEYH